METKPIKLNSGNSGTIAVYDERKSSIFWSKQSTNCYDNASTGVDSWDASLNSFDKNLKRILSVPKPSSKKNK